MSGKNIKTIFVLAYPSLFFFSQQIFNFTDIDFHFYGHTFCTLLAYSYSSLRASYSRSKVKINKFYFVLCSLTRNFAAELELR